MGKKFILIGGIIIIILLIVLGYYYYPFTEKGCENLGKKIQRETNENKSCNLAADCPTYVDLGCSFECGGFFTRDLKKDKVARWISRYHRRCQQCEEVCFSQDANPACLSHTCTASGDKVVITTDKEKYAGTREVKLHLQKNVKEELSFSFPISLCLRPVIMRLEEYNEKTNEWLSAGVGLLFDGPRIIFYKTPDNCPVYKIAGCERETAYLFINESVLTIDKNKDYTVSLEKVNSCDEQGKEIRQDFSGRFRIGLYYESEQRQGEQVYSNEFVVEEE